jgi:hypothetical protein
MPVSGKIRRISRSGSFKIKQKTRSGKLIFPEQPDGVIEDPIFRISSDSIFIQAADVIKYTLKEQEFPQGARRKLQADKNFYRKLRGSIFVSQFASEDGIIRI